MTRGRGSGGRGRGSGGRGLSGKDPAPDAKQEAEDPPVEEADDDDDDDPEETEDEEGEEGEEGSPKETPEERKKRLKEQAEQQAAAERAEQLRLQLEQFKQHRRERKESEMAEASARFAAEREALASLPVMKKEELEARAGAWAAVRAREKQECERMSGWSHLQELDLSCNPIKSEGAAAIAAMLRMLVPKTEEDLEREREEAAEKARLEAEERERRKQEEEERRAAEAAARAEAGEEGGDDGGGGKEAQEEAGGDDGAAPEEPEGGGEGEGGEEGEDEEGEKPAKPLTAEERRAKLKDGLTTIRYLDLSDCEIGWRGLRSLAEVLTAKEMENSNHSITSLMLRRNKFGVKREPAPVPEGEEPPEKPVKLERPDWLSPGIQALSEALRASDRLTELDLSSNSMGAVNAAEVLSAVAANSGLTMLGMDSNRIAGQEAGAAELSPPAVRALDALSAVLTQRCTTQQSSLEDLRLGYNFLGPLGLERIAGALSHALFLTRLDLGRNCLRDQGMALLATAASGLPGLKRLSVCSNGFGLEGARHCAAMITKITGLEEFSLADNPIGAQGWDVVQPAVNGHISLSTLDAALIGLSPAAAGTTAALVGTQSRLTRLDLSENDLGAAGMCRVLDMLALNKTLHELRLWGSAQLSDALLEEIADTAARALKDNASVLALDLGLPLNDALAKHREVIEECIQRNRLGLLSRGTL
eukprot:TRINITY_DN16319_c0_g1_i2.p2 TRINITY_DN16319_c0_g1~~TRINITY_DN16319_c0_g1_i2.p2  ORF type:complete len:705 (+),score=271.21 TRINITY_DN16319_c0_g1_i2:84-2198(+)